MHQKPTSVESQDSAVTSSDHSFKKNLKEVVAIGAVGATLGAGAVLASPYIEQVAVGVREEIQSLFEKTELSQEDRLKFVLGLDDKDTTEILKMEPMLSRVYEDALWFGSGQITFNEKS